MQEIEIMNNNIGYSLVIWSYNQEKLIAESIKSAFSQECPPIEILISDDCSSDNTFEIIQELAAAYSGPHIVKINRNSENLGLIGHINKIHELSSGDVIILSAGDDISRSNRCKKIMEHFEHKKPLLIFSNAEVVDMDGKKENFNYKSATLYKTKNIIKIARSMKLYLGATGAWHRGLYDKYGQINEGSYEDLVMGFRAALEGKVHIIPEKLVIYRMGSGITNTNNNLCNINQYTKKRLENFKVIKSTLQQRHKDATTFGYSKNSSLLKTIQNELLKVEIRIKYFSGTLHERRMLFLRHPILTSIKFYSERKKIKKFRSNF